MFEGGSVQPTYSIDLLLAPTLGVPTVLNNGVLGSPRREGNAAVSSASVDGNLVRASTTLNENTAQTTLNFTNPNGLVGNSFLFYAENYVNAASDVASFTGSIEGGDLQLFQYDNADTDTEQTYVIVSPGDSTNAELTAFGSGQYSGFGSDLEDGDYSSLTDDGEGFVTESDLGLALLWTLTGAEASVTVDYTSIFSDTFPGQPDPGPGPDPDPGPGEPGVIPSPSALPAGILGLSALLIRRRRHG